jgi:hypothetical protein
MKSKLNTKQQTSTYPVLMQAQASKRVVLFTDATTGTVVNVNNSATSKIGDYSKTWTKSTRDNWKRYDGTVELSND